MFMCVIIKAMILMHLLRTIPTRWFAGSIIESVGSSANSADSNTDFLDTRQELTDDCYQPSTNGASGYGLKLPRE